MCKFVEIETDFFLEKKKKAARGQWHRCPSARRLPQ
jgi:hypothetical protein